jgi:hypothetical protein
MALFDQDDRRVPQRASPTSSLPLFVLAAVFALFAFCAAVFSDITDPISHSDTMPSRTDGK